MGAQALSATIFNIAIRVDASVQIGTGHFMRCLTLADELNRHGARIRFVCRHLPEHLRKMLSEKGHEITLLRNTTSDAALDQLAHTHWLGTSQARDAAECVQALSDRVWDWLIVDHYALDSRWEKALRKTAKRIMVIDDIADRQHDCDVLLDQNFYADMKTRYVGKVPSRCKLLLGPRYALLRDEFREFRKQVKARIGEVKRILVFFGGVDADNLTGLAIEALKELDAEGLLVDVVIGAQHPCRDAIKVACAAQGYACHVQTSHMARLMAGADLAIGAGGSAMWERAYLGLPTITVITAPNQQRTTEDVAGQGAIEYKGSASQLSKEDCVRTIKELIGNPKKVAKMSEAAFDLVPLSSQMANVIECLYQPIPSRK